MKKWRSDGEEKREEKVEGGREGVCGRDGQGQREDAQVAMPSV